VIHEHAFVSMFAGGRFHQHVPVTAGQSYHVAGQYKQGWQETFCTLQGL